jgi:glycosyltransferase involved in cell wall biosynthesis
MEYIICHLTTAHNADDVRIFYKECLSLSNIANYKVIICAPGSIPSNNKVIHYRISKAKSFRLIRFIHSQFITLKVIFKIKPNVWHIHDPELLPVASLLVLMKQKVVWDSHEDYYKQFSSSVNYRTYIPSFFQPIIRFFVTQLLNYIDQKAVGIVCATESIAEKYQNKNTIIVGNEAILRDFGSCRPNFKNKSVLFIGQPSSSHCYMEIVEAVANIPELKLVVACKKFDKSLIDFSVKILENRFEYVGWLDRKNLSRAISDSSIGLLTYKNHPNHQDNKPNKFYEFCAAGLPILATPTIFNNDLINKSMSGVLSRGFDSKSLELGLLELISSEQNWTTYSTAAKRWVEENGSWSKSELVLLDLYGKIL